jgi:thioredoxin
MKYFLLSLVGAFICALFIFGQNQPENLTFPANSETVALTKAGFLKNVENYQKNPKIWIYENDKPCIVEFFATWCGPCRKMAPDLEELASKYKGKLIIYKVDTDKEKELTDAFGINSIPTMLFCPVKGNPQIAQGALSKKDIEKIINKVLLTNEKKKKKLSNE